MFQFLYKYQNSAWIIFFQWSLYFYHCQWKSNANRIDNLAFIEV